MGCFHDESDIREGCEEKEKGVQVYHNNEERRCTAPVNDSEEQEGGKG